MYNNYSRNATFASSILLLCSSEIKKTTTRNIFQSSQTLRKPKQQPLLAMAYASKDLSKEIQVPKPPKYFECISDGCVLCVVCCVLCVVCCVLCVVCCVLCCYVLLFVVVVCVHAMESKSDIS
jgi:uncharacterized membrane protein